MTTKYDYANAKKLATSLIRRFGRSVKLQRIEASETGNRNVVEEVEVQATMMLPNQVRIFGLSALGESARPNEQIVETEVVYILVPPDEEDFKRWNCIEDSDSVRGEQRIIATQVFKPGDTSILGYIGAGR